MDKAITLRSNCSPCISYAYLQNRIRILRDIEIVNDSDEVLSDSIVTLTASPSFFAPCEFRLPNIAPGESYQLGDVDIQFDYGYFARMTEAERGTMSIALLKDGTQLTCATHEIEMLARGQWSGLGQFPELIAAFVQPNDPAVDRILGQAQELMAQQEAETSIIGYDKNKQAVWRQLSYLWQTLLAYRLGYILPPASFEATGQKLRNPTQILSAGIGTCIDTSLLVASCLEQANLNPILIFTKGHAFVGCWLSDSSFNTIVVDDAASLRKHIDLKEIVVFESTLLSRKEAASSFSEACALGRSNLREDVSHSFLCAVDIARARLQGIKPLPSSDVSETTLKGEEFLTSRDFAEAMPKDLDKDFSPIVETAPSPLDKLDGWQRKLLDLSLRNSLLNYRMGNNKRYVEFIVPDPERLEDKLSDGERFTILSGPAMFEGDQRAQDASPAQFFAMQEDMADKLFSQAKLLSRLEQKEMNARLLALYRASKNALEEGGANTLYLAYGFLTWLPSHNSKQCKAPLILIPVRLERKNVQSHFTMVIGEDEPRFNMTLLEMLRRDFDITALDIFSKELPHDDHGLDIDGIWRRVQHTIKDIRGWEVSHTIGIGLFSFAKYLMWKDIAEHSDILRQNKVVEHLVSRSSSFAGEPDFISPNELDSKLRPQDVFCPLLADSSQLSAIASASAGKTFVLEGPPGTGKSQTIANMIAHCLAHNKTVLFVAEKAAALNVVYQRLKNIGLGDFCLELHSNKANKADVIAQLGRAASNRTEPENEWDRKGGQLARVRTGLNEYVRHLHKRYPNGLSAYHAMGTIVRNRSCQTLPFSWPSITTHDRDSYEKLFDIARRIAEVGYNATVLSKTSLRHIGQDDWSPRWETQEFLPVLDRLNVCAMTLSERAKIAQELTGLPFVDACGTSVDHLRRIASLLPKLFEKPWRFLLHPDAATSIATLRNAQNILHKYDEIWNSLSVPYASHAADDDLAPLREIWMQASLTWWPKSAFMRSKVTNALKALGEGKGKPDCAADLPKLKELHELRKKMERHESLCDIATDVFRGMDTDRQLLDETLEFADCLNEVLNSLISNEQERKEILDTLCSLSDPASSFLKEDGQATLALRAWNESSHEFDIVLAEMKATMHSLADLSQMPTSELVNICQEIKQKKTYIHAWSAWLRLCMEAQELGLASLAEGVCNGTLDASAAEDLLRVNYARWWICGVIDESPVLRKFSLKEHERLIEDFKEQDENIRQMTAKHIASVLRSTPKTSYPTEQWRILQHEVAKKKRHMSVRRLMENIPDLLPLLTPCLLMSPLSVAQFLPAGRITFDLVIFDEASQIPVWDSIGAIARGDKAIVVGDTKQLPPTNFFQKADDDQFDEEAQEDLESILEECIGSGMPRLPLRWHYRSRHESLICFSNHRYYDGGLITFPAPDTHDDAVSFHFVENGVYERGSSRTNPKEARAVVEDVVRKLKDPAFQQSGKSIGIVTFNVQQQTLIEDLLDAERQADPELEHYFGQDVEEPVFVKNIENIQGDERDIMYFSICFAPDLTGKFSMNFGALNRDGGERRLNVAITRARYELRIFSSIYPNQILNSNTKAKGVQDLRLFLEFAQLGVQALAAEIQGHGEDYESPFEQGVAKSLNALGWKVHPQVGVSGFRIDLGVVDPDSPGDYLAGVECDGATYHRSATARDRDRLRESVLRGLGWEIVRIWSTDWWLNQDDATQNLHERLTALLEKRRHARKNPPTEPAVDHTLIKEASDIVPEAQCDVSVDDTDASDLGNAMQREHMLSIIDEVITEFSPIHEDDLCTGVARSLGYSKAGRKIKTQIIELANAHYRQTTEDVGTFFWKEGQTPDNCTFRHRGKDEVCNVVHIAMPELMALARKRHIYYDNDPAKAMANELGLSRLRGVTRSRLEMAWSRLRESKR